eukprot:gene2931-4770_t
MEEKCEEEVSPNPKPTMSTSIPKFNLPIEEIVNKEEEIKFENSDLLAPSPRLEIKAPKTPRIEKEQHMSLEQRKKIILKKILKSGINLTEKNKEKAKHLAECVSDSPKFFESFFATEIEEKETWKIKLIISEIKHTQIEKNLRTLVSPLLQISEVTSTHASYGLFHTAILIGPLFLEWSKKSFCVPKKIFSTNALFVLDLGIIETSEDLFWKISETVVYWNVFKNYNNQENNCFHFIDEIMHSIGRESKTNSTSKISKYIKKLKLGQTCEMSYIFSDEIKKILESQKNEIVFKSHSELDLVVQTLIEKIPNFEKEYKDDFEILKCFDRAFWLRMNASELKHDDDEMIKYKPSISGCPFKDPALTNSFKGTAIQKM